MINQLRGRVKSMED